ncbi:isochorismatase domain-containing protein 2 isoform X2 [Vombatus ursinus]|uniref:isochorismatase domain-containing protein 2 isoform X2 n=1 Tax=Vombatus ursinus TaxID=29139 RepID=UPI000FFD2EF0|nr:isochorismatase domain-containing protein 2 isoform X2 [Vombatus ursinus]
MATARPALGRVLPGSSMLFLCDMQEKFRGTISFFPQIVAVSARMLQVARMLDIPVMLTEQYPTGLGPTVPELGAQDIRAVPKTCFSMVVPEVERLMNARPSLRSVLLCGIEAQACIMVRFPPDAVLTPGRPLRSPLMSTLPLTSDPPPQSTALDLLERGLDVHVVADACSSRSQVDRLLALSRMRQSGAFLTTSECLILQLVRDSAHPRFKEVQKLIRDPAPDSGLLGLFQGQSPLLN